jgi:hypothetical protein
LITLGITENLRKIKASRGVLLPGAPNFVPLFAVNLN